jgi:sugar/nucleoside kinase (ribokinase family)
MSIVVVGDVMVDVVAHHDAPLAHASDTPARVSVRPGGGAGNVAAWLGSQGSLVACVGDDPFAEIALSGLDRSAVTVAPGRSTGVCVVLVDAQGERTMLPDPGANLALQEIPAAAVLYVSGYTLLRPETRAVARAALRHAARTVVDCASAAPLRGAPEFLDWITGVDLLLANEEEADVLGPRAGTHCAELVVKRGAGGATWTDGSRTLQAPARPTEVRDTTGAGDAFAAGFLSRWPDGPEAALQAATALAAEAVGLVGGRPARSSAAP